MKKLIWFLEENFLRLYIIGLIIVLVLILTGCGNTKAVAYDDYTDYEVYYAAMNEPEETYYFEFEEVEETGQPVLNCETAEDVQVDSVKCNVIFIESIPLSEQLQEYIFDTALEYDISPYLIFAIIERESNYKAKVMGDKGESYGLMQIKKKYQTERMKQLGVSDLLNAKGNVLVGIDYLSELFEEYQDVGHVLHAYNGGVAYANRLSSKGLTSKYASGVLQRASELERSAYE